MQVRLGQPGIQRDGVHAGTFVAVAGELVFRSLDNGFFVLLADSTGRFTDGLGAMRRDF
ncbi:hypothetical protein D3C87_1907980 [compost metagenome]